MTPSQQKRTEKLAEYLKDKDLAVLSHFLDLGEKIDANSEELETLKDIKKAIDAFSFPEPIDHREDLKKILDKLDEEDEIEITLNII